MDENINDNSQTNDSIKVKPKITNKPSKCDICGASITWFNRARHLKTKKPVSYTHLTLPTKRIV